MPWVHSPGVVPHMADLTRRITQLDAHCAFDPSVFGNKKYWGSPSRKAPVRLHIDTRRWLPRVIDP